MISEKLAVQKKLYIFQMRGKKPKNLHDLFYFLQNVVEFTVHCVLYLSPRLDISSDNYLKFNIFSGVSRSLKDSGRFVPLGPISLGGRVIIFCSSSSTVFPREGVFRTQNPP